MIENLLRHKVIISGMMIALIGSAFVAFRPHTPAQPINIQPESSAPIVLGEQTIKQTDTSTDTSAQNVQAILEQTPQSAQDESITKESVLASLPYPLSLLSKLHFKATDNSKWKVGDLSLRGNTGTLRLQNNSVDSDTIDNHSIQGEDIASDITLNNLTVSGDLTTQGNWNGVSSASGTISTGVWHGSTIGLAYGGTGITSTPTDGQLLIGNGSGYTLATLTAGTGIGIANGSGGITLTNTGVTALSGTANQINVSGSTGSVTLSLPQDIAVTSTPTFGGLTLSGLTAGSIPFIGSGGVLSQNNSQLFWDNANGRLGIGTTSPTSKLSVSGDISLDNGNILLSQVVGATAPTVNINSSAGNLNGTYYYMVTFVTATGETDSGSYEPPSVTPINQQVNITNIPTSSDSRVIARKIYRTVANPTDMRLYKFLVTINDNTTTTYTDNIADVSLGSDIHWINTTGGYTSINGSRIATVSGISASFGLNALMNGTGYANSAFGGNSLTNNTSGLRNTALGVDALYSNTTGNRNTATGVHALNTNNIGSDNTAFGYGAGFTSTSTTGMTAFGAYTLYFNTTGSRNTATGYTALQLNTTGSDNTANGYFTLNANTTGSANTATGYLALRNNTSGINNTGTGNAALTTNTIGYNNTANGYNSLFNNTGGFQNTANGYTSLSANTTGSNNTASGLDSLAGNTTGTNNTASGFSSGKFIANGTTANQTSNNSLYLGYGTRALANGDTNEVVIGASAIGNGSNSVTLGNTSITSTVLRGNVSTSGQISGTDGLVTKVNAGVCDDTTFTADTNGNLCIDSTNGRIYYRYGGAWHYTAQTAGFQIPEYEAFSYDFDKNAFDKDKALKAGDFLIPFVENSMKDGAVHGLYTKFSDVKDKLIPELASIISQLADLTKRVAKLEGKDASTPSDTKDIKLETPAPAVAIDVKTDATVIDTTTAPVQIAPITGTDTIKAGDTSMTIKNNAVTKDSRIFVTVKGTPALVSVDNQKEGESFKVVTDKEAIADIDFSWEIINGSDTK
jgi:hypothetical protein